MIPRLRWRHLRSVAPRALLPREQPGDMAQCEVRNRTGRNCDANFGFAALVRSNYGERGRSRNSEACMMPACPLTNRGIGSVMLRSALTTMMLLCGGLAGAQEIGDCGHPVPERSISACSVMITRGGVGPAALS